MAWMIMDLYGSQGLLKGGVRLLKLVHAMLSRWYVADFLGRVSFTQMSMPVGFEALFKGLGDGAGIYLDGDHVVFKIGALEGELAPAFKCQGHAPQWIPHYPMDAVIGLDEAYVTRWLKFLFSAADEVRFVETGAAVVELLEPIEEEFDISLPPHEAEQAAIELSHPL